MLLLIALQKLAASSIAAIRSALSKRRARLAELAESMRPPTATISDGDEDDTLDDRARADEEAWGRMMAELMDDEVARLDELLELAEPIRQERKIDRLVELIESELPQYEPVLLFTEYKATQAMVEHCARSQPAAPARDNVLLEKLRAAAMFEREVSLCVNATRIAGRIVELRHDSQHGWQVVLTGGMARLADVENVAGVEDLTMLATLAA